MAASGNDCGDADERTTGAPGARAAPVKQTRRTPAVGPLLLGPEHCAGGVSLLSPDRRSRQVGHRPIPRRM